MGPLKGIRIVEFGGIGPGPFCGMLLADLGADVLRIDRAGPGNLDLIDPTRDFLNRGRRSVALDLKQPEAREFALQIVEKADALIEGFRPGVMERMGLGPDLCAERNPRLVYGRMTGWGQSGPLAHTAGHDITYVALSGTLSMCGRVGGNPVPPLNVAGDFGGGGMLLAMGILAAIIEARTSGQGQVIDAAMVDGSALVTSGFHMLRAQGINGRDYGQNMLDTGSHFYEVYETADGKFLAVGAIEPQFYRSLVEIGCLPDDDPAAQMNPKRWPVLKEKFAATFRTKTRDEWAAIYDGSDACVAPVLTPDEAARHPHNAGRGTFLEPDGVLQPAPAPRFSRTPASIDRPPPRPGDLAQEALLEWGISGADIDRHVAKA